MRVIQSSWGCLMAEMARRGCPSWSRNWICTNLLTSLVALFLSGMREISLVFGGGKCGQVKLGEQTKRVGPIKHPHSCLSWDRLPLYLVHLPCLLYHNA